MLLQGQHKPIVATYTFHPSMGSTTPQRTGREQGTAAKGHGWDISQYDSVLQVSVLSLLHCTYTHPCEIVGIR